MKNTPRRTEIRGQDHMLAYITPDEAGILKALGGAGKPGPMGIPSYYDEGEPDSIGGDQTGDDTGEFGGGDYGGYEDEAPTVDQPATSGFGVYGAQESFDNAMGITDDNPYGRQGFFSRVFGIDPKNISYAGIMSPGTRRAIRNNQFSKFANPQNVKGMVGYNEAFPTAPPGQLRPGVQKAGYNTMFGPVMSQFAEQSTMDMTARGVMGLFGGLPGLAVGQMGTQEYGLPGLPGFESFDPNNPRGPQSMLGKLASAFTGGIDPTQAAEKAAATANAISDYFSSKPSAPAQVQSVTQQAPVQGFEDAKSRFSTGVSRPDVNLSISKGKGIADYFSEATPDNPVPGVSVEPLSNGMSRLSFPDGRTTTMNPDGTINSFGLY